MMIHQDLACLGLMEKGFQGPGTAEGVEIQENQQVAACGGSGGPLRIMGADESLPELRRSEEEKDLAGRRRVQEKTAFSAGAQARFEETLHGKGAADGIPVRTGMRHDSDL